MVVNGMFEVRPLEAWPQFVSSEEIAARLAALDRINPQLAFAIRRVLDPENDGRDHENHDTQ